MLNYKSLQNNETVFLSVTSVTVFEFQVLFIAFVEAFAETAQRTVTGEARFREKGGGQHGKLPSIEERVVIYFKLYQELPASNVSRMSIWIESAEHLSADSRAVAKTEKSVRNTRLQT